MTFVMAPSLTEWTKGEQSAIQFLWLKGVEISQIYGKMHVNLMAISMSQRKEIQEERQTGGDGDTCSILPSTVMCWV